MRSSKGYRTRTRKCLKKHPRNRGMPPLSKMTRNYEIGDYVDVDPEPAIHKGLPHRRFIGKTGIVIGKRGRAYLIQIKDKKKEKTLITLPEHISPSKSIMG
ncbi:MAG: 50S ribosomal protein L21e [Promethearchaeota archaeon]